MGRPKNNYRTISRTLAITKEANDALERLFKLMRKDGGSGFTLGEITSAALVKLEKEMKQ